MFSFVTQLVGRDQLCIITDRVTSVFLEALIKSRTLCDLQCTAHICHGCFSYAAAVTCERCNHVKFCYGCMDYGNCCDCDADGDDENAYANNNKV